MAKRPAYGFTPAAADHRRMLEDWELYKLQKCIESVCANCSKTGSTRSTRQIAIDRWAVEWKCAGPDDPPGKTCGYSCTALVCNIKESPAGA